MEGYEGVAALRGVPPPNGGCTPGAHPCNPHWLRGVGEEWRGGGGGIGQCFFIEIVVYSATLARCPKLGQKLGGKSQGGWGKSAVYFYLRSSHGGRIARWRVRQYLRRTPPRFIERSSRRLGADPPPYCSIHVFMVYLYSPNETDDTSCGCVQYGGKHIASPFFSLIFTSCLEK